MANARAELAPSTTGNGDLVQVQYFRMHPAGVECAIRIHTDVGIEVQKWRQLPRAKIVPRDTRVKQHASVGNTLENFHVLRVLLPQNASERETILRGVAIALYFGRRRRGMPN